MFQIRKNNHYYEIISYQMTNKETDKNEDRERDYTEESAQRAKRTIIDYALNNDFNYMINITLDINKVKDRTNLEITKSIRRTLNNIQQRIDPELQYILVPEYHKRNEKNGKKAIHYHGLIKISEEHEKRFMEFMYTEGKKTFYRHNKFYERYGASNFIKIYNNNDFIAFYMSKYIGKQVYAMINDKYYYNSNGLKKSDILYESEIINYEFPPDYQGQFCSKWKLTRDQLIGLMIDNGITVAL